MKVKKLTKGFVDKDLPPDHSGSFGRLDKGRIARFEIENGKKVVVLEFFVSFLDSVANAETIKVDEQALFRKAQGIAKRYADKIEQVTGSNLFFLYNFSANDFDIL